MTGSGRLGDLPLVGLIAGRIDPASIGPREWTRVLADARSTNLVATLAACVLAERAHLPDNLVVQLESGARVAEGHRRAMHWEIECVARALTGTPFRPILLKGAAYCVRGLPNVIGRQFGDIDVLVPEAALDDVESRLRHAGWRHTHTRPYDQKYYRRWMHELPPMMHGHRGTTIDVHHRLVPRTSRIPMRAQPLIEHAVVVPDDPRLATLSDIGIVLHSAVHLFTESEFNAGLRNLYDLHRLIEHYAARPAFGTELADMAEQTGLDEVTALVAHWTRSVFGTRLPPALARAAERHAASTAGRLATTLVCRAMHPDRAPFTSAGYAAARAAMYVRGHYLRMPLKLLVPHLWHQATARETVADEA